MITALVDLLGVYYQAGNPGQMALIARSMLATIPGDLVAMQFLGLALYQLGRHDASRRVFGLVARAFERTATPRLPTTLELAAVTNYREATRPETGLSDAWHRIGHICREYGFAAAAEQAFGASRRSVSAATVVPGARSEL